MSLNSGNVYHFLFTAARLNTWSAVVFFFLLWLLQGGHNVDSVSFVIGDSCNQARKSEPPGLMNEYIDFTVSLKYYYATCL
jgi:hypothetical protein